MGVDAFDRGGLQDIEGFALGQTFDDVKNDDVAEALERREVRERMDSAGRVLIKLDEAEVRAIVDDLVKNARR